MAKKEIKWFGNTKCDFCGRECDKYLIDGMTIHGPWATMCKDCYQKYAIAFGLRKFGIGIGQLYEKNTNGEFIKING